MPIIRDGNKAREIINDIKASGNSLPCFCTENVITTEAIFAGVQAFKIENNITGSLPLIIAFTASYAERQQLLNYSNVHDFREGFMALRSDIERLARDDGPYKNIDVIVHLDHAQPGTDDWIFEENSDFISSVMYDCSHYSIDDNTRMIKNFVTNHKEKFVIEGCVDEIYNYSADSGDRHVKDDITTADDAENYFNKTGVDLVVANLGTEHRRTEGALKKYHREAARSIKQKIGRQLVLHGTSSLSLDEIKNLPGDGIVKVNIWTILEVLPGKTLAKEIIKNLHNILDNNDIEELIKDGIIQEEMLRREIKPSLDFLTEQYRRDVVLVPGIIELIKKYYSYLYTNM
jgi:fructose-bisphosphate aldolase class II